MRYTFAAVLIILALCGRTSAGQSIGSRARVAGIGAGSAGAVINSVLNAVSPEMRTAVIRFLDSPGCDVPRLKQELRVIAQAPALPPAGLAPQAPSGAQAPRLSAPQGGAGQALLAEKLQGLVVAVGPLLAEPSRLQLTQAASFAQSRLPPDDRKRLAEKMAAMTRALGRSAEIAGEGSTASPVPEGDIDEASFARQRARLLPSMRRPQGSRAAAAGTSEASPEDILSGTWRRVSGKGVEHLAVTSTKAGVRLGDRQGGGYEFSGINGPEVADRPWHGSRIAPGGRVVLVETTRFDDAKLEWRSVRTETPMLWIPTRLVTRYSLALRDGRLIQEREATLYRRAFFYFGPFNTKTSINTSNLVDPERPLERTVYERVPSLESLGSRP